MSLESKYGEGRVAGGITAVEQHAVHIEAYEHICRAALTLGGPIRAPALLLDPKQLDALFTEKQLDVLIIRPLKRATD
jgi:hypothetical protein